MKRTLALVILMILAIPSIASAKSKTTLSITSDPDKINIIITGSEKTQHTPVTISLEPGTYAIWGGKAGYSVFDKNIKVIGNRKNRLLIHLHPVYDPGEGDPVRTTPLLPYTCPHFRIEWDGSIDKYLIVPNIPFNAQQPPQYFFKKYWRQYQSYGVEAIKWMSTNKDIVLTRNNSNIEWWGKQWWPKGAKAPTLKR